ncbi:MAG: hypothetical protein HYU66_24055 [Armatimonadetes bacterium]|nr:hypothetical protein [Armatimonadota bacterium]
MGRRSLCALALAVLTGCGGGGKAGVPGSGGGGGGAGGSTPPQRGEVGTALFHVDVPTGQVQVTPLGGGRAVFAGSTIGFNSSLLIDQPGDVGRKALTVSLTNHSGEPLGELPDGTATGVKLIFGTFTNVAAFTDLRPRTQVRTVAGSGVSGSTDGTALSASFVTPVGVATAPDGSAYITDSAHYIRMLRNGLVTTLAGNGTAGSVDGLGSAARLNSPWGIARNPVDGALIVTEAGGQRVRRVTSDGRVTTVAGTGATGSANGAGNAATFNVPIGVAVDAAGGIFVVEYTGQVLRKIVLTGADPLDPASYTVTTLAGLAATAGSTDAVGSAARFNNPAALALAPDGTLFVADSWNHKIRRVSPVGEVVTIAGMGVAGSANGSGQAATFNFPRGIVWYGGALFVTEVSGRRVRQVSLKSNGSASGTTATSWRVATLAGSGSSGSADGAGDVATFDGLMGAATDAAGNVLVADYITHKVREVSPNSGFFPLGIDTGVAPGEPVRLFNPDGIVPLPNPSLIDLANTGEAPYLQYAGALEPEATSAARQWLFIVPSGVTAFEFTVTVEAKTSLGAPPEGAVGVGSANVMVRTIAGRTGGGYHNGVATEAGFANMQGISIDAAGNLFVADTNDSAIRRVTPDGFVSTVAGVQTGGSANGTTDGLGTVARLNGPSGVAVTPDGTRVFVADTFNHTIRLIRLMGSNPADPSHWTVSTIAGLAGTAGYVDSTSGDLARFQTPGGIAIAPGGMVYISEQTGNRIRRLELVGADPTLPTSWLVSLLAGSTAATPGNTDALGSAARFSSPRQIAVDRAGNVYLADFGNYRIREVSPDGGVRTLAGSGVGYHDDANGLAAKFTYPKGIGVDPSGYVYVGDAYWIRRVSPSGAVTTVAGRTPSGAEALDLDGLGTVATISSPQGIAVGPDGSLYFTAGGTLRWSTGSSTNPGLRIRLLQRIIDGH